MRRKHAKEIDRTGSFPSLSCTSLAPLHTFAYLLRGSIDNNVQRTKKEEESIQLFFPIDLRHHHDHGNATKNTTRVAV